MTNWNRSYNWSNEHIDDPAAGAPALADAIVLADDMSGRNAADPRPDAGTGIVQ